MAGLSLQLQLGVRDVAGTIHMLSLMVDKKHTHFTIFSKWSSSKRLNFVATRETTEQQARQFMGKLSDKREICPRL